MPEIGQRKFAATAGSTVLVLGLSFWGLMVGKLDGSEFISAIYATCFLVGGFIGLNVTNSIFGKGGGQ